MPKHKVYRHRRVKYKNILLLFLGILGAIWLARQESIHQFLLSLDSLGYFGAFIAGMLFAISFTSAIGAIVLLILAESLSAVELGIIAGLGAMFSDLLVFHFVRDNILDELIPIYNSLGGGHLNRLLHTHLFSWTLPVLGALIIASPLPDELGVSLIGLSKMKTYQFVFLSFALNAAGIFLLVLASNYIKP